MTKLIRMKKIKIDWSNFQDKNTIVSTGITKYSAWKRKDAEDRSKWAEMPHGRQKDEVLRAKS